MEASGRNGTDVVNIAIRLLDGLKGEIAAGSELMLQRSDASMDVIKLVL